MLPDFSNLLSFAFLTALAALAVIRLCRPVASTLNFIVLVHYFYCGIPMLLDVALGPPDLAAYPGLLEATEDETTLLFYCGYMVATSAAWTWLAGLKQSKLSAWQERRLLIQEKFRLTPTSQGIVGLLIGLPLLLAILSPDPSVYFTYASHIVDGLDASLAEYHSLFCAASSVSILLTFMILADSRSLTGRINILYAVSIAVNIWMFGKRSIMAVSTFLACFLLWMRFPLARFRTAIAFGVLISGMLGFSALYQSQVRSVDLRTVGPERMYQILRLDFSRDHMVKLAIYAQLNQDQFRLLDYPGQSLMAVAAIPIPRSIWPNKPWAYAYYATSASLYHWPPEGRSWGLTTCWLDEALANFGWFAIVLGPLLPCFLCRLSDRALTNHSHLAGALIAVLALSLQISASWSLVLLWLIAMAYDARQAKSARTLKGPPTAEATGLTVGVPRG